MNLASPKIIKELLSKHGAKPNKIMGQNFLIDRHVLEKIIKASNLNKNDTVLEVGPGIGTLTQKLAENAGNVIAIEKDETMVNILSKTLADFKNVKIIHNDILKTSLGNVCAYAKLLPKSKYKVVANIPYYITSPIIRKFLEANIQPQEMLLMIQKEVAQRICATPPDMNLLAVSVQFYAEPKIISYVSKNCFWPAPKVDSAIIKITPHAVSRAPTSREAGGRSSPGLNPQLFFKIVKAGFSHPRKQLASNLANGLKLDKQKTADWLKQNNISPTQRAETLSVADWHNLVKSFPQV